MSMKIWPSGRAGLRLFGRAGIGLPEGVGAADLNDFFDDAVQKPGFFGVCRAVVNFFAGAAAGNQSGGPELAQVVGDGGAAHLDESGEVDDALFAVAENPENADPVAVVEQAEDFRGGLKVGGVRDALRMGLEGLAVIVRKCRCHGKCPPFAR